VHPPKTKKTPRIHPLLPIPAWVNVSVSFTMAILSIVSFAFLKGSFRGQKHRSKLQN
jgi:hypothetical protein